MNCLFGLICVLVFWEIVFFRRIIRRAKTRVFALFRRNFFLNIMCMLLYCLCVCVIIYYIYLYLKLMF